MAKRKLALIFALLVIAALVFTLVPLSSPTVEASPDVWTQTTQADFELGTGENIDTATSPGSVILSLIANPTLITSDNTEKSVKGTTHKLVKTLQFTKSGSTYDELRIDTELKADPGGVANSDIHVDDVSKFTPSNDTTSYVLYQNTLDFSAYADNATHTIMLYLWADKDAKTSYNRNFEVYRTKTYAASGWLESSANDCGYTANFGTISFTINEPSGTELKFQIRTATTEAELSSATWYGPTGTGDYYETGGTTINSIHDGDRWVQYKAYFQTGDNSKTPTLEDITISYEEMAIFISFTVTDNNNDGIKFGSLDPGQENQPADQTEETSAVTLTVGSETNVDCDIKTKASDFSSNGDTITIDNAKWDTDNNVDGATAMTTTYAQITTSTAGVEKIQEVWHWLSVPGGKPSGSYTSTFYYQAIKSGG